MLLKDLPSIVFTCMLFFNLFCMALASVKMNIGSFGHSVPRFYVQNQIKKIGSRINFP